MQVAAPAVVRRRHPQRARWWLRKTAVGRRAGGSGRRAISRSGQPGVSGPPVPHYKSHLLSTAFFFGQALSGRAWAGPPNCSRKILTLGETGGKDFGVDASRRTLHPLRGILRGRGFGEVLAKYLLLRSGRARVSQSGRLRIFAGRGSGRPCANAMLTKPRSGRKAVSVLQPGLPCAQGLGILSRVASPARQLLS